MVYGIVRGMRARRFFDAFGLRVRIGFIGRFIRSGPAGRKRCPGIL